MSVPPGSESSGATTFLEADHVCLALPAPRSAELLRSVAPELAAEMASIELASAATVSLMFPRDRVSHALDGMGFVVPEIEREFLIACTFASTKFLGRCPDGTVMLRAFVGGAMHPQDVELSDAEMTARAVADVRRLLGATGEPEQAVVTRWRRAMPQYHLGHLDRTARMEALLGKVANLTVAGNLIRGVGIPDCIANAERAAQRVCS